MDHETVDYSFSIAQAIELDIPLYLTRKSQITDHPYQYRKERPSVDHRNDKISRVNTILAVGNLYTATQTVKTKVMRRWITRPTSDSQVPRDSRVVARLVELERDEKTHSKVHTAHTRNVSQVTIESNVLTTRISFEKFKNKQKRESRTK